MEGQDNVQVEQWLGNIRPGLVTRRNVLHHWKHGQCCEDIQCYERYAEAADSSVYGCLYTDKIQVPPFDK